MEKASMSLTLDENNLETFSVIWLEISTKDAKKNIDIQHELRKAINCLNTFQDSSQCQKYIRSLSKDDRIVLIVNGRLGEELVPHIHHLRQVTSIYIYCTDEKRDGEWTKQFTKVRNVFVDLDALVTQIQFDQMRGGHNNIYEPFSISIFNTRNSGQDQSTTELNGQFVHSQMLIDCLLRMKSNSMDKNELINLCKKYYGESLSQLNILNEFEHTYSPDQALWWYTRESFLCRLLNKALRMQNINLLFLFRFFIRDIQRQLEQYQCSSPIRVYRGQLMSNEELQVLKDSVGKLISTSSFLSTSVNREVALFYSADSTPIDDLQHVLFDIDVDPRFADNRPFANISSCSHFPNEEEVLIMTGSIFRLVDIHHDENQLCVIRMTLCSNNDYDLKAVIEETKIDNRENNEETTNLLSFGNVLWTMGKFDDAEKYYHRLLNELLDDHKCIAPCYYGLGKAAYEKGDFDLSLEWHQKSLNIRMLTLDSDDPHVADSYNSIGSIYYYKDDYKQALESYHQAFVIRKKILGEDHPITSDYFNNVGVVYEKEKKYTQAVECHQKALSILEKCPSTHYLRLGGSHGNIGDVHRNLGQYDLALEHYNVSLEIYRKSLPPQHPNIAENLNSIGLIYEKKGELKQALLYFEKAAAIDCDVLLPTHPRVINTKENIQRISSQLK